MPSMTKLVLAVDDEPDILEMLKIWLESYGYRVMTSENGRAALQLFGEFGADLVILDIMMPGMDGLEVLSNLKAEKKNVNLPVVMLTAKGDTKSIFEAQRLGATDFLMKPFEEKELARIIESILK